MKLKDLITNLKNISRKPYEAIYGGQPNLQPVQQKVQQIKPMISSFKPDIKQIPKYLAKPFMNNPLAGNGNVQKTFMPIAKTLQRTPQFEPGSTYQKLATGMPLLQVPQIATAQLKSYGKTLENVITPQGRQTLKEGLETLRKDPSMIYKHPGQTLSNPAVQAGLDLSDLGPGGLIFGGLKAMGKAGLKTGLREAGEQGIKRMVLKGAEEEALKASGKIRIKPSALEMAEYESNALEEARRELKAINIANPGQEIFTKMRNFLRFAGEKVSKETGELFREHIPRKVFGESSDELAMTMGITENELMGKLTEGFQMAEKSVKNMSIPRMTKRVKDMYEKLDPQFYKVIKDVFNKVDAVSVEPTISKIKIRNLNTEEQVAKQSYNEWKTALFKQETPRTTMGAVKDAAESLKKTIKSPLADVDNMRDISGFQGGMRDYVRNFKQAFGKNFQKAKEIVLNPFDKAKGELVDFQNQWIDDLNKNVIQKFGIKKGSRLSELTQMFGEKQITQEELRKLAPKDWFKVVEADSWFRNSYNKLLDEVNSVRKRIYPNDPTKIIPKREDYYRHFREIAQGYKGLLNIFETPAGISSTLSGISEFTKPKSKWLSFAQRRLGAKSEVDAVGGFLDYVKSSAYATKIDPQIGRFRNLADELAQATSEGANAGKLNNFIEFLQDFSNDLSGKTNPMDRTIQKWIPGGRKTFRAINWLNSRVKANVILGNLSSSLAQIFNVPQGIAEVGVKNSTTGLVDTLASIFKKNKPMSKSSFIKERYSYRMYDQFESGMLENGKKMAAWITGVLDEVGTKYIWNSAYRKALGQGIDNAIGYADDIARRMVAGRGIGEVPLAQKSRLFQLVAPFQLEVANLWWVMKDWVDEKSFGKLATFVIASYVFNRTASQIRGSDVSFDPINATLEALKTYDEEENKGLGALKAGGRLAGEVLSNVPLGQTGAAMYPEYGFQIAGKQLPTRKELFGKGDPTRFGGGLLVGQALTDPLYKLIPPYAGQQIKRTIEGLTTTNKGYAESKTGLVQYPVEKTPTNYIKSAVFGKSSTPEAQEYYKSGGKPLGEKQSEVFKSALSPKEVYAGFMGNREETRKEEAAKTQVEKNGEPVATEKKVFYYDNGEVKSVLIDRELKEPKLTGNKTLNKELLSDYKSEISSKMNDVVKLYDLGWKSEADTIKELEDLSDLYDQVKKLTAKGKKAKAKKVSFKVPKTKSTAKNIKITIKKTPTIKLSAAKPPTIKPLTLLNKSANITRPSKTERKRISFEPIRVQW